MEQAVASLSSVVSTAAAGVGGALGSAVADSFSPGLIRDACRQIQAIQLAPEGIEQRLDAFIGDPLRRQIQRRSELAAVIADAHISVRKIAALEGTMTW